MGKHSVCVDGVGHQDQSQTTFAICDSQFSLTAAQGIEQNTSDTLFLPFEEAQAQARG